MIWQLTNLGSTLLQGRLLTRLKSMKETGVKFEVEVTVKPEVTLGQYKGLSVEKEDTEVKDEDMEASEN